MFQPLPPYRLSFTQLYSGKNWTSVLALPVPKSFLHTNLRMVHVSLAGDGVHCDFEYPRLDFER
jgi:hypothetical protein